MVATSRLTPKNVRSLNDEDDRLVGSSENDDAICTRMTSTPPINNKSSSVHLAVEEIGERSSSGSRSPPSEDIKNYRAASYDANLTENNSRESEEDEQRWTRSCRTAAKSNDAAADTCYIRSSSGSSSSVVDASSRYDRRVVDLRDYVVCPPWSNEPGSTLGLTAFNSAAAEATTLTRPPINFPADYNSDEDVNDKKYFADRRHNDQHEIVQPVNLAVDKNNQRRSSSHSAGLDCRLINPAAGIVDVVKASTVSGPSAGSRIRDELLRGSGNNSRYGLESRANHRQHHLHQQQRTLGDSASRISTPAPATMTKGNGESGGGAGEDDDATPSVLRALLQQASGKQAVVYGKVPVPLSTHRSAVIQHHQQSAAPGDVGAHRRRRRSAGLSDEMLDEAGPRREQQQQHDQHQQRSEIKALLMGERYHRVPVPRASSPTDAVDLSRRRTVLEVGERGGGGGRRSNPVAAKRARVVDDTSAIETHVIYQEHSLSPFLVQVVDLVNEFDDLSYSIQRGNLFSSVEIRRKGLYGVPALGVTPAQIIVEETGQAHFLTAVASTTSATVLCRDSRERLAESALRPLLLRLSVSGGHVFCPGVAHELVELANPTSSAAKSVARVELGPGHLFPSRFQDRDCPVWFRVQGQGWLPLNEGVHRCTPCKGLERRLKAARKSKGAGGWTADGRPRVTSAPS